MLPVVKISHYQIFQIFKSEIRIKILSKNDYTKNFDIENQKPEETIKLSLSSTLD